MLLSPAVRRQAQGDQAANLEAVQEVSAPLHPVSHFTQSTPSPPPPFFFWITFDGRLLDGRLEVRFVYQPRTRPPQPIVSSPFPFLSTVKSSPEEWFQVTTTMAQKLHADIEPIDCHVSRTNTLLRVERNGA